MKNIIIVRSSHGLLTVDDITGRVVWREIDTDDQEAGDHLKSIDKFDLDEYTAHYKTGEIPSRLDILDLGYWYAKDGGIEYEEPAHDWRIEVVAMRGEN